MDHLVNLIAGCFNDVELFIYGCDELDFKTLRLFVHPNLWFYQTVFGEIGLGFETDQEATLVLEKIVAGILSG
jgi:hypothetical protein